jgi:hypothetical protein
MLYKVEVLNDVVVVPILPILAFARLLTGNEATTGMVKAAASTIFLSIARRPGSTVRNTRSSFFVSHSFSPSDAIPSLQAAEPRAGTTWARALLLLLRW